MRRELVVPLEKTGVGIDRDQRRSIQVVPPPIVAVVVRIRVARAPINEIELWIVTARHPCAAATTGQDFRIVRPGLAAGLTGPGHRVEPPDPFARLRIVCIDEPARRVLAARDPDNDFSVDHERGHRRGIPYVVVRELNLP